MNGPAFGLATPDTTAVAEPATRPCLLVNPRSFSASKGLAAQASDLAREHGAEVVTLDGAASTTAAIESILARRQRLVIVLAGDGTVCAIVDQLSQLPPGSWIPDLVVLPGGRTNLTAADLVPGGQALETLKRVLEQAGRADWNASVQERCALRIEQSPAPVRHGFFLAGAAIDGAIRQCHLQRADIDHNGTLSTALYLAQLGVRSLFGRSSLICPTLQVDAGAIGAQQGPVRVLLATTLLHRQGLFDPYAPRGQGAVRITSVSRAAPRFWRSLLRVLTGRFTSSMNADNGYLSGRSDRVTVHGLTGYMLDGEPFDADPSRPVLISAGPPLRFVTP